MADRKYHLPETQGVRHVDYLLTLISQATGTVAPTGPVQGEGDPNSSYVTTQRGASGVAGMTGVTGTYIMTTLDGFQAVVYANAQIVIVGQASGTWTIEFGTPVQNSSLAPNGVNATWSIPFTVYSSGTATDLPIGSEVYVHIRLRNSQVKP